MAGEFKLENLRIDPADLPAMPATPAAPTARVNVKQPRKRNFAQITDAQINRMIGASGATWMVLIHLAQLNWRVGGPIKLANTALAKRGVNRKAKYRALDELERRGVIKVKRRPRKSPEITVLD